MVFPHHYNTHYHTVMNAIITTNIFYQYCLMEINNNRLIAIKFRTFVYSLPALARGTFLHSNVFMNVHENFPQHVDENKKAKRRGRKR